MDTALRLGPLLRHVDETSATVWVQTQRAGHVELRAGDRKTSAPTFSAHGYHYAVLSIDGLKPGSHTSYSVHFDGEQAWPPPNMPPSFIRTYAPEHPTQLVFGSCRAPMPDDAEHQRSHGVDLLRAYADALANAEQPQWPAALVLLGDQVYADHLPPAMREFIAERRDLNAEPGPELADYDEYAEMYRLSWSDPPIRWLLANVPSVMIFDDHDVRDDWNTSLAWREEIEAKPWWSRRITAGLSSYWIYQHLGNLSADERGFDPLWRLAERGGDITHALTEFAYVANADPASYRWSFRRDFGATRLLMLDTRCGRELTPGARKMLPQWSWVEQQTEGEFDHLLIGSSLPVLLPLALHHAEQWSERVADGAWGSRFARFAERIRQILDLEHWAAFGTSFAQLTELSRQVADKASVTYLSGDVHYSYVARSEIAGVNQVVCSPIRNPLGRWFRYANIIASWPITAWATRLLSRTARGKLPPWTWRITSRLFFENVLAEVEIQDKHQQVSWFTAHRGPAGTSLVPLHYEQLAP